MDAAFEMVEIASAAELHARLGAGHAREASVRLVTRRKDPGRDRHVSTGEILDAVLSYGWIDGIRRELDDTRTTQLIASCRAQRPPASRSAPSA